MTLVRSGILVFTFILIGVHNAWTGAHQPAKVLIICDDLNRLGSGVSGEKYIPEVRLLIWMLLQNLQQYLLVRMQTCRCVLLQGLRYLRGSPHSILNFTVIRSGGK